MPEEQTIRVLLVAAHPFTREGLRSFLLAQDNMEIVGEATYPNQAIVKARSLHPSVVIMDISTSIIDGLEAAKLIRIAVPNAKVLVFMEHGKEFTSQFIEVGAHGYLGKSSPPAELVRAIEMVHRGGTFYPDHNRPNREKVAGT